MKKQILFFGLFAMPFLLSTQSFAAEATGSLSTGNETAGSSLVGTVASPVRSGPSGGGGAAGSIGTIITTKMVSMKPQNPNTNSGTTEELLPPTIEITLPESYLKFRDIGANWAYDYITLLAIHEIVDNASYFRPDDYVTRAEFVKMVLLTAGLTSDDSTGDVMYDDVPATHSLAQYISTAASLGLVNSRTDNFYPNRTITRAEAMKILVLALGEDVSDMRSSSFDDVGTSNSLFAYIEKAKELGIISGQLVNGKYLFRPADSITRAEMAKILVKGFGISE